MEHEDRRQQLLIEISTAVGFEPETAAGTEGPTGFDLAVLTVLAHRKDKPEILYLIREAADQYAEAATDEAEEETYKKVSQIVFALLYTQGDPTVPEPKATPVAALELFRAAKEKVLSQNDPA